MLAGGCFCGAIRYQANGTPFHEANCYCSMCRRIAGAPVVAWFTVLKKDFNFTQGTPQQFQSSPEAIRSFCPNCGTHLTFASNALPEEIDVTICSLDDANALPAKKDIHLEGKLNWFGKCNERVGK